MREADPQTIPPPDAVGRSGFRLARLEVYNWGTFDRHVWALEPRGENTLLTGDIGSGKSTLVDAITTLLVPPQKLAYNKAAGAEAKERSLRSYVLGYFKSARTEAGTGARAVPLRTNDTYSIILARFANAGYTQTVTLAQVFWMKDTEGQPARMFVVADKALSIAEDFSNFGTDISALRKRLRKAGHEIHDSFPPYGTAFRRRFGIENEQALELFHQTVSMKSVGNLTDFVREHMLQPFPVEPRITALIGHFDDLNRAHEAVLKARDQINRLEPLVADCERHAASSNEIEAMRGGRDALRPWFAQQKGELLNRRLEKLGGEISRLDERIASLERSRAELQVNRDEVKRSIAENGGGRIEWIKAEVLRKEDERNERQKRANKYDGLVRNVGLLSATDAISFASNRTAIDDALEKTGAAQADVQNEYGEKTADFVKLREEHDEVSRELASLRQRRSNIPFRMLELRANLCRDLGLEETELPFAGELLQVREDERDWEGAIERVAHNFGLSLLVTDAAYEGVAQWVDRTHLGGRLVYYRVRPQKVQDRASLHPDSLVHKLAIKPDSQLYSWLEAEVARRFDLACCDTLDQFRRERRALTRSGQIKDVGDRHEKDDRNRIDDRSRYVLGWSNEAKVAAIDKQRRDLETRMQDLGAKLAELKTTQASLTERLGHLKQLGVFESFRDLDWKPMAAEIDRLEEERRRLEAESDVLRALQERLNDLEEDLRDTEESLSIAGETRGSTREKEKHARGLLTDCVALLDGTPSTVKDRFPTLTPLVEEVLAGHVLTIESCDNREKDVRETIQKRIDAAEKALGRLAEKIVQAMRDYCHAYPLDTREADASVAAAAEYVGMLERLRTDDLPKFEGRFKELLNENTVREIANFQSQLRREQQSIHERVETINRSLHEIDYNPGRYILLVSDPSTDPEIREFQQDLRACTEGALTGSDDDAYSEAKFLQVRRIIERFRGRDGTAELDARWTRKVTDVRNWFGFSASERWREDDREHEHYADSGGKSGGQKEKLAYTVLAASLAYQFGLEWGAGRSRSFRFVVIDEAFGRGSDESTRYGLELFDRLDLQLLIVTPLQKIHVIEPHIAGVGFVHNEDGRRSMLRNLTIEQYRAERAERFRTAAS